MKNDKLHIAKRLLKESPLSFTDAARIILEVTEEIGERAKGLGREEMLSLFRRIFREGIAAIRAGERTVTLEAAAWASVEARAGRRPTTLRDLRHYVRRILRVEGAAGLLLRQMTSADCRRILKEAFGGSASSYRKGRSVLHSILAYGVRQEWADSNPVERIDVPQVVEQPIRPLTMPEVRRLQQAATKKQNEDMRLSLHLMLYCGIRPTEVERLQTEDIDWKRNLVIIRPTTSKTGGGRVVPLRCREKIQDAPRVIPRDWMKRWKLLRDTAGFRGRWVADICRHTFASYHAAYFHNIPLLQQEMGHRDSSLLYSRYMSIVQTPPAQFWKSA